MTLPANPLCAKPCALCLAFIISDPHTSSKNQTITTVQPREETFLLFQPAETLQQMRPSSYTSGYTWHTPAVIPAAVVPSPCILGPAEAGTLIQNRRLQITEDVEFSLGSWHELSSDASWSRTALLPPGRFIIKTFYPDPYSASLHLCFWLELLTGKVY